MLPSYHRKQCTWPPARQTDWWKRHPWGGTSEFRGGKPGGKGTQRGAAYQEGWVGRPSHSWNPQIALGGSRGGESTPVPGVQEAWGVRLSSCEEVHSAGRLRTWKPETLVPLGQCRVDGVSSSWATEGRGGWLHEKGERYT